MTDCGRLREIMRRLRDPEGGCPWDRAQTAATIVPYTLEEAYEVADAVARGDWDELQNELGDLLFHIVFYAHLADEEGRFNFDTVASAVAEKLIRRHPHVFADEAMDSEQAVHEAWEQNKARERAAKDQHSVLDGVPLALPAMTRAYKLQKRAARVGFDWSEVGPVLDKLAEESAELRAELDADADLERLGEELGDLLFTCVNLARQLSIEPEGALRAANRKFEQRFAYVEAALARAGKTPQDASLEEMDALWERAKGRR